MHAVGLSHLSSCCDYQHTSILGENKRPSWPVIDLASCVYTAGQLLNLTPIWEPFHRQKTARLGHLRLSLALADRSRALSCRVETRASIAGINPGYIADCTPQSKAVVSQYWDILVVIRVRSITPVGFCHVRISGRQPAGTLYSVQHNRENPSPYTLLLLSSARAVAAIAGNT